MDSFLLSPSAVRNLPILILDGLPAVYLLRGYIALSRNPLRAAPARTGDPAGALSETNRLLVSDPAAHPFVAVACATLDPVGRALHRANAG